MNEKMQIRGFLWDYSTGLSGDMMLHICTLRNGLKPSATERKLPAEWIRHPKKSSPPTCEPQLILKNVRYSVIRVSEELFRLAWKIKK